MIKKHPYLFASSIAVLLLLNLWKWLPSVIPLGGLSRKAAVHGELVLDFPDALASGEKNVRRNLFQAGAAPGAGPGRRASLAHKLPKVEPTPVPTPEGLAADGSVAEAAGGYRLLGIASRQGQAQALIGKGTQLFQVGAGEDLEGRYKVESITESEVYLTEDQSGTTLKLRIWDQQGSAH